MGISYPNVLLLRDVWTMHDLERGLVCPEKIADGKPRISIIDNDDFLNDTLTGGGTAHRCNWMFLQRQEHLVEYEASNDDELRQSTNAKTLSEDLTQRASDMQAVTPYKTINRGEPPIGPKPTSFSSSTNPQHNVHAVHIGNWDEYVSSLRAMLPWMIAYDNNRYGRWLPDFWVMLTTLPD